VTWRRVALAACWLAAAGWGLFYIVAMAAQQPSYAAAAIAHFIIGYALGAALMARPLTQISALIAIVGAGAFTRVAMAFGMPELLFAPLGPIAAFAAADWATPRNLASSIVAFVVGFVALIWLTP
jgi:hypothetical protein